MTNKEAINWLISLRADIWKIQHQDLWHYEQALAELINLLELQRLIPCSERLPEYGQSVLTYDGGCFSVEKRIYCIRDDDGEPIEGDWWVSDDYDENNSEYYINLRDGAVIAWMPLPEYKEDDWWKDVNTVNIETDLIAVMDGTE